MSLISRIVIAIDRMFGDFVPSLQEAACLIRVAVRALLPDSRERQLWSDEFTISIMALESLAEQLRSLELSPLDTRRWSFEKLLRRDEVSRCNRLGCVACCRARISPPWTSTGQKRWRARGEAQIRELSVFAYPYTSADSMDEMAPQ